MAERRKRYSRLEPMDVKTEALVAAMAASFFTPMAIHRRRGDANGPLGPEPSQNFLAHLKDTGVFADPDKYLYQIRDLLARMERDNILVSFASDPSNVMLPKSYFRLSEVSALRARGSLWLAKTLGGRFVHAEVSRATVHIVGEGNEGEGSGIVFGSHHVLTCRHVVEGMKLAAQQSFQGRSVGIDRVDSHPDADVAVVRTREALNPVPGLAFLKPEVSQKVFRFGYARVPCSIPSDGGGLTIESGEVTSASVRVFGGDELFLYSAVSRPGDSGGAIVSEDGYVAGMTTALSDTRVVGQDGPEVFSPHYAGVPSDVIAKAVAGMDVGAYIPYETFE